MNEQTKRRATVTAWWVTATAVLLGFALLWLSAVLNPATPSPTLAEPENLSVSGCGGVLCPTAAPTAPPAEECSSPDRYGNPVSYSCGLDFNDTENKEVQDLLCKIRPSEDWVFEGLTCPPDPDLEVSGSAGVLGGAEQ